MGFYDFFEQRKVTRISARLNEMFARRMAKRIRALIKPGDPVLEIGAGKGLIARLLCKEFNYSAYEPNPGLAARLVNEGITIKQTIVPPLLEKDGSQKVIVHVHVLEHMESVSKAQLLFSEIRRVLSIGGYCILVCPDFLDLGALFFDADYTHNYVTTPNRVYQLVSDSGLTIVERQFIFDAFTFFPGILLNCIRKIFFFFINPLINIFGIETPLLTKLRGSWGRSLLLVCKKEERLDGIA